MHAYDELAGLLSRNLTFNPEIQQPQPTQEVPTQEVPRHMDPIAAPSVTQPIVYSISQHYHHSTHIPRPQQEAPEEPQRRSSESAAHGPSSESILRSHGIEPATLTPSQLQLFRIADDPQKLRLIELWNICPPNSGGDIPALAWSSTTIEQEEHLARVRYERLQQQKNNQTEDGRWNPGETEPYMTSGYEEIMRREREREERQAYQATPRSYSQSTDPAYMGPNYHLEQQQLHQQMSMANQYGAFEQFRGDAMDVM